MLVIRVFGKEKQIVENANEKMAGHKKARMRRNHISNLCNSGFNGAMNVAYVVGTAAVSVCQSYRIFPAVLWHACKCRAYPGDRIVSGGSDRWREENSGTDQEILQKKLKSTLLKVLMCLYHLDQGEYQLKVETETQPMTSKWRSLFAYVPQGNALMSGTIREVVTFGIQTDKSEERIWHALQIAEARDFVMKLPQGLDTFLGEMGAGLSEGQMQRIAIARAIYANRPILVLDESTSELDEETEKKVLSNLREMTEKTVLIVTHRKAALEICDMELRFSEGSIREIP